MQSTYILGFDPFFNVYKQSHDYLYVKGILMVINLPDSCHLLHSSEHFSVFQLIVLFTVSSVTVLVHSHLIAPINLVKNIFAVAN